MTRNDQKRMQWQALVARFRVSGMSQTAFAASAGVGIAIFRYWLYRLRDDDGRRPPAPRPNHDEVRLVPVEVRRPVASADDDRDHHVEIDVATLRLRSTGADPRYLASVVAALRELGC